MSVSAVLVREEVGLEELADAICAVHFGPIRLRTFDEHYSLIRSTRDDEAVTGANR